MTISHLIVLTLLVIPFIVVPVGAILIGRDLWRHELARYNITLRIALMTALIGAAILIIYLVSILEQMRIIRL